MEKTSLPLAYYLNNGEPDKTGYEQTALSAFYKAVSFHPNESCITLGPNAQIPKNSDSENILTNSETTKKKKNVTFLESLDETGKLFSPEAGNCSTPTRNRSNRNLSEEKDVDLLDDESPEGKEEKLIRKRILSSLENICLSESEAKINTMRREWMKRDQETMTRLQEELDETTQTLEEKLNEDFNKRQVVFENIMKNNEPKKVDPPRIENGVLANVISKNEEPKNNNDILQPSEVLPTPTSSLGFQLQKTTNINASNPVLTVNNYLHHNASAVPFAIIRQELPPHTGAKEVNRPDISPQSGARDTMRPEIPPQTGTRDTMRPEIPPQPGEIVKITQANMNGKAVAPSLETNHKEAFSHSKKESEKTKIEKSIEEPVMSVKKFEEKKVDCAMDEDVVSNDQKKSSEKVIDPETERIMTTMVHYKKYFKIYNDVATSLKIFLNNNSLKKFRSECQRAVNVPVNAITAVSAAHLNDKLSKLTALLSGVPVLVNNKSFNSSQHPLGVTYCTYLLAEKIVKQGEDAVSVKGDSAFPIALVVLEMWRKFPKFGDILIGAFHKACPYLIPIYWIKEEGMTNEDYYRKLGFIYIEGAREDIDMFLKRQGGIVRLYFSIIISHMKNTPDNSPHPLPLTEAWRWLAMFTALEPSAEITATLLYDMLDVAGHSMLKTYGKQFLKLIHLICVHFVPKIEKVTPEGKGGPVSRLKSFLEQLIRSQDLKPPKGILPANFW